MSYLTTKGAEELDSFLWELGKTSIEVAKTLRKRKCKGIRKSSNDCPIAKAVVKEFGGASQASCAKVTAFYWGLILVGVRPTQPVEDFIHEFDDGYYPDLERS